MSPLKLLIFTRVLLLLMLFYGSCHGQPQSITAPVTVKAGDTLDGLIIKLADQYGDARDYREIRCQVKHDNQKSDSSIFPGEVLNIRLEVEKNEKDR